ncbi:MAG: hypothetical protein EOP22_02645 [Hyphomicrobiales bacterium]|nr:MAG: hypothetical protein EOP22_02645 [Hyphomicrobiales bacterium]
MVFRMARPTRRQGSTFSQFKQRIPRDIRAMAVGKTFVAPVGDTLTSVKIGPSTEVLQFSLRTRDPDQAKARQAVVLSHWASFLEALRHGPRRLTQKEVVALSGEAYREFVAGAEDDPGNRARWEYVRDWVQHTWPIFAPGDGADGASTGLPYLDRVLAMHGLVVDLDSRKRLHDELGRVLMLAADRLNSNAHGDYSEDKNLNRFPALRSATADVQRVPKAGVSLTGLVDEWWGESSRTGAAKPATHRNYSGAIRTFVKFLKHDDAARVRPTDVVAFKDFRLAHSSPKTGKPLSPRTVHDNDLAALKSVFAWAVENHKVSANPALGIRVKGAGKLKAKRSSTPKGFTDDEARVILAACNNEVRRPEEAVQSFALRRWVPWVLAYTGARVGEIIQLRKQDVQRKSDHWVLVITPEAGTVKTDTSREVPIHPHLVELGFVDFATSAPGERLFIHPTHSKAARGGASPKTTARGKRLLMPPGKPEAVASDGTESVSGRVKAGANRLREFVHGIIPNLSRQPNHAWRHRMETVCRDVGIDGYYQRIFTGHSLRDEHERYGEPAGLYREICRLPRFEMLSPPTL